jgi:hypothetical protein
MRLRGRRSVREVKVGGWSDVCDVWGWSDVCDVWYRNAISAKRQSESLCPTVLTAYYGLLPFIFREWSCANHHVQ